MNNLIAKMIAFGVGVVGVVVLLSFLLAWPVMMLWNECLIPAVEGVHEITWLQAWGISILFGILFKPSVTSSNKD